MCLVKSSSGVSFQGCTFNFNKYKLGDIVNTAAVLQLADNYMSPPVTSKLNKNYFKAAICYCLVLKVAVANQDSVLVDRALQGLMKTPVLERETYHSQSIMRSLGRLFSSCAMFEEKIDVVRKFYNRVLSPTPLRTQGLFAFSRLINKCQPTLPVTCAMVRT